MTHTLQLELFLLCSNIQFMAVLPIFHGTLASYTLQEQLKTEIQEWEKRHCNIQRSYSENKESTATKRLTTSHIPAGYWCSSRETNAHIKTVL